jgi:hypothetical protein
MAPTATGKVSMGERIFGLVRKLILPSPPLGELWEGAGASDAFREGSLKSQSGGKPLRIAFRNLSSVPLLLCWISENGDLKHFRLLGPSTLSETNLLISEQDTTEKTFSGHAFCLAHVPEDQIEKVQKSKSLKDTSSIIAGYRPFPECGTTNNQLHLVTISRGLKSEEMCCQLVGNIRKRRVPAFESSNDDDEESADQVHWIVKAALAKIDPTPWDTSTKVYELKLLGGWPCYLEPNWHCDDPELQSRLEQDLRHAGKTLPPHAVEYLRRNCPIWVNSTIKYGPKACPVKGVGCCYHPDKNWLIENGLRAEKQKCVEINDGPGYKKDLDLWGPGGVMVHELSHAYHHRMLPDGYDNKEILACYEAAMKEGLYDCVKVHGPQGPEAKAYASSNCMEYFAELSAAFLGGTDETEEYNKWFPFNRKQLKAHDPRAYKLLCRLWKVDSQ